MRFQTNTLHSQLLRKDAAHLSALLIVLLMIQSFAAALPVRNQPRVAVIGGGASGIFSAIAAAQNGARVRVLEAGSKTLTKVKISGGGRCNVMHDTSKSLTTILDGYPRGKRELNGLFHKQFGPLQAQQWFESRGVELKTESDGRMVSWL
jgi:predicted flavoprotein YhiN